MAALGNTLSRLIGAWITSRPGRSGSALACLTKSMANPVTYPIFFSALLTLTSHLTTDQNSNRNRIGTSILT
jgi:hypothetical protein